MKNLYGDLKVTQGFYIPGICQIKIAPIEWIQDPVKIDFKTGKVIDEVILIDNKNFYLLEFAPESYLFDEKPKSNRGGSFYEKSIQGDLNNLTPELVAIMETLRNHEVVAILKDKRKRTKLVGTEEAGLVFRYYNKESNKNGGEHTVAIDLTMEAENISPFYEI